MSHLPDERLAALIDEPPTTAELAHLASCARCARERSALESLRTFAMEEQASIGVPLTTWEALAPALREDGTIDTGEWRVARRTRRVNVWLQVAAAVLLVIGGVAYGRYSSAGVHEDISMAVTPGDSLVTFANVDSARAARNRSALLYQSASLYLAEHDSSEYSPDTPAAMKRRLATLDEVGQTVREALNESPYDPVINGYYLTTLGQREATLRQLNASLPVGVRMNSF